eukprot:g176.t1
MDDNSNCSNWRRNTLDARRRSLGRTTPHKKQSIKKTKTTPRRSTPRRQTACPKSLSRRLALSGNRRGLQPRYSPFKRAVKERKSDDGGGNFCNSRKRLTTSLDNSARRSRLLGNKKKKCRVDSFLERCAKNEKKESFPPCKSATHKTGHGTGSNIQLDTKDAMAMLFGEKDDGRNRGMNSCALAKKAIGPSNDGSNGFHSSYRQHRLRSKVRQNTDSEVVLYGLKEAKKEVSNIWAKLCLQDRRRLASWILVLGNE